MVFENPREARERTSKALKQCFEYFNKAYEMLEKRGRSAAHGREHVYPAALEAMRIARENASKQGLSEDCQVALANLAAITGMVHDLIRRVGETGKTGLSSLEQSDGFKTAKLLETRRKAWLKQIREGKIKRDETGLTLLEDREFNAIIKAIRDNELELESVKKKLDSKPENVDEKLEKILLLALTWGDKGLEGLGPKVVKRRAEFVAGERHDSDEELKPFVEKLKKDGVSEETSRKLVFLLESLRRIRGLKAASDYPEELKSEVDKLRELEEDVYYSLLKHISLLKGFKLDSKETKLDSEEKLLEFGLKHGYPGLEKVKEKIKRNIPSESEKVLSGISEEKARAAADLVLHYAKPNTFSKPSGRHAEEWISKIEAELKRDPRNEFEKLVKRL